MPPQDVNGVVTLWRTLSAVEHGLAEALVVLERRGTLSVGVANSLSYFAWNYGFVHGFDNLGFANVGASFLVFAIDVAAFALEEERVLLVVIGKMS